MATPLDLPAISFPAFYNAVMRTRGISFPAHLGPVDTALADQRIRKLMLVIGPGSGKSLALSVVYPCYALGSDPSMTILEISAGEDLPQGFMQAAMEIMEHNPHFRKIFPTCRADKKAGWSTLRGLYVNRPPGDPDASFFACGLGSKALTGKHAKLIILDDLHDALNSLNEVSCKKVIDQYYNTIIGRADPSGARFLLAGRRWTEFDIYGHMRLSGSWVEMKLPAERKASSEGPAPLYYDVYVPLDEDGKSLECCFTEGAAQEVESDNPKKYRQFRAYFGIDHTGQGFYWPNSPQKRAEYFDVKRNNPTQAASVYQGEPGGREAGIFLDSDFRFVRLGQYDRLLPALLPEFLRHPACRTVQSWDTAHDRNPDSDYSVCVTAVLIPCAEWHNDEDPAVHGRPDFHYDAYIVDVFRDKLEFGGLMSKVRELATIWGPSFIAIERSAGAIPLIQSLAGVLPITPVNVHLLGSKRQRVLVSLGGGTASVQGWLRQGRVKFWAEAPWFATLRREMLDFSGDGSGHDDQVDSLCLLISQAILLGSGSAKLPSREAIDGDLPDLGPASERMSDGLRLLMRIAEAERSQAQVLLPGITPSALPAIQVCGNCRNRAMPSGMCAIQKRPTVAIDSCESWRWKEAD